MASREKIGVTVAMIAEAYTRPTSPAFFEAYYVALSDLPDESIDVAGTAVLRGGGKFMPTPGEIRALAITGGAGVESRVDAAWATLVKAVEMYGHTKSVNFRDGLINATVRQLGGWEFICLKPYSDFETWVKKDFSATYTRFMQSGCSDESMRYLPGLSERENYQWIGRSDWGKGEKVFELPTPADVDSPYKPLALSPPAAKQITKRPVEIPRIQFKEA